MSAMRRVATRAAMALAGVMLAANGAGAAPAPANGRGTAARPPNIVLILADDLGYGDLGCYGQRRIATPNLDRMAREGIRFTDFYAGAPVCAPSRSVLLTGQDGGHTPVRGNATNEIQHLRPGDVSVASLLARQGYATALFGKWGLGDVGSGTLPGEQGFGSFYGYLNQSHAHNHWPTWLWDGTRRVGLPNTIVSAGTSASGFPVGAAPPGGRRVYAEDLFRDRSLAFIEANRAWPFFLFLSTVSPHANNESGAIGEHGMEVPDQGRYARENWPDGARSYAAMVTRLDDTVGRVMAKLTALGIERNTILLFSSDNGVHAEGRNDPRFFTSSGPLRGIKRDVYEGGIRVPTIAWGPGLVPAGIVSHHIGSFADLLPTAAALNHVPVGRATQGVSLAPTLLGRPRQQRVHDHLYWEFYERGGWQAARQGRWKAVRQPMLTGPVQLYDLSRDIGEQRDVAARHPRIVARMTAVMAQAHVPDPRWKVVGKATD